MAGNLQRRNRRPRRKQRPCGYACRARGLPSSLYCIPLAWKGSAGSHWPVSLYPTDLEGKVVVAAPLQQLHPRVQQRAAVEQISVALRQRRQRPQLWLLL